jgi:hypothetical protein
LKCVVTNTPATVIDDCKNQILQTYLLPTNSIRFNRIQSGGSFKVINVISYLKINFRIAYFNFSLKVDNVSKPGVDVYPPSQVRDLKVVSMNVNQMSMTIEWTAPGDDLDKGTSTLKIAC